MADDENKSLEDTEPPAPGSADKSAPDAPPPKKRAAPGKRAAAKKTPGGGDSRIEVQLSATAEPRGASTGGPEPPRPFWWRALLMVAVVVTLFSVIRNMAGVPQSHDAAMQGKSGSGAILSGSDLAGSGDVVVEEAPSLPPADTGAPAPGYYGYPYAPGYPGYPAYPMAPRGGYGYGYGYPYPQQHPWPPPYYYRGPTYYPGYPPYPGEPVPVE